MAKGSRLKPYNEALNRELKVFAATSTKMEIVVGYVRVCLGVDGLRRQSEQGQQFFQEELGWKLR
jgi:hypothetical protein